MEAVQDDQLQHPRLFRFEGERWLDIGFGRAMLLPNTENEVRFIFALSETGTIATNHSIINEGDYCNLRPNAGNECCWAWSAQEETPNNGGLRCQWFALKFTTKALADSFRDVFDRAKAFIQLVNGSRQQREMASEGSKLYTFGGNQWGDAVPGRARILMDRVDRTTSFSFTKETSQMVVQHNIVQHDAHCKLQPNAGSDVCWTWSAHVGPNSEVDSTHLALKFVNSDLAAKFKASFDFARALASQAGGFAGEQEIYSGSGKLHRWCNGKWLQQGLGEARLLRHSKLLKVRFVFHKAKTAQVLANHFMARHESLCNLKRNAKRDDCWTWSANDLGEGAPCEQQFALKFAQTSEAIKFKEATDLAMFFVPALPKSLLGSKAAAAAEATTTPRGSSDATQGGKSRVSSGDFSVTLTRSDLAGGQQHFVLGAQPQNSIIRIGRASACECRTMVPGISTNHVELRLSPSGILQLCDVSTNGTVLQQPGHKPKVLEKDVPTTLQDGSTIIIPAKIKSSTGEADSQRVQIVVKFAALALNKAGQRHAANHVGSRDPTTAAEEDGGRQHREGVGGLQEQPHVPGEGTQLRLAAARAILAQAQADTSAALTSSVQQVGSAPLLNNGIVPGVQEHVRPPWSIQRHDLQAASLPVTGATMKARPPLPIPPFSPPPPPPPPRPKCFLPPPVAPHGYPTETDASMNSTTAKHAPSAPPSFLVAEVLETMAPQKMASSRTNGCHHSDTSSGSPKYRGHRRGTGKRPRNWRSRSRSRRRSRRHADPVSAHHRNQPSEGHGPRLVAVKGVNRRPNMLPAPQDVSLLSQISGGPDVSVWPPVPTGIRSFLS